MRCFSLITTQCDFHLLPDGFVQSGLKDGRRCQEHALSEEKYGKWRPERAFQSQICIFFIRVCDVNYDETFDNINLAENIDHNIKDVAKNDLLQDFSAQTRPAQEPKRVDN